MGRFISIFNSNFENKKADNLSGLSASILSQNFRAHNFPFLGKIFFMGGLNFHLLSFCKDINFKLIFKSIFPGSIRWLKFSELFLSVHYPSLRWKSSAPICQNYR